MTVAPILPEFSGGKLLPCFDDSQDREGRIVRCRMSISRLATSSSFSPTALKLASPEQPRLPQFISITLLGSSDRVGAERLAVDLCQTGHPDDAGLALQKSAVFGIREKRRSAEFRPGVQSTRQQIISRGIHPPKREVEECGEGHPPQVWCQHPPGGFADAKETAQGQQDGRPQQDHLNQRPPQLVCSEEDWRPRGVEDKLDEIKSQCPTPALLFPDEPRGHRHHQIEKRPDRAEDPTGRIPFGFVQRCIPNSRPAEDAEQRCTEGDSDESGKC